VYRYLNHLGRLAVLEHYRALAPVVVLARHGRYVLRFPVQRHLSVASVGSCNRDLCLSDALLDQEAGLLKLEDSRI